MCAPGKTITPIALAPIDQTMDICRSLPTQQKEVNATALAAEEKPKQQWSNYLITDVLFPQLKTPLAFLGI